MKILFIIYENFLGSFQLWLIKQPLQLTALPKRNIVMYFYMYVYKYYKYIHIYITIYFNQPKWWSSSTNWLLTTWLYLKKYENIKMWKRKIIKMKQKNKYCFKKRKSFQWRIKMTWMDVILWLIWTRISFISLAHTVFKCNTNWTNDTLQH